MLNNTTASVFFLATDVDCRVCPARKYVPCTNHDGSAKSPCAGRAERAEKAARRDAHKTVNAFDRWNLED